MNTNRRSFLQQGLLAGGFLSLLESGAASPAFAQQLLAAAADDTSGAFTPPVGQHDSKSFWDSFGAVATNPDNAAPAGVHGRGLIHKSQPADNGAADLARQIDFFHVYTDPDTKQSTLRFATSIDPSELMEHDGDIQASVNVNGFRMAGDDRQTFDKLQSAQLRIDVLQGHPILQYMEPMAWMSLAALFPDKTGKLPPLQNLSFDPSANGDKMQQIILPGGAAQMAVNLSMAHKDSMFLSVVKNLTTEVNKFSPVLGLPSISVTALKGFCSLYGAMEQRTTFLLNSMPLRAFATRAARADATTAQGMNLVPGDYVLVPHAFTEQLTPHLDNLEMRQGYLDNLEMRQGYLVPKGSPKNSSVYDLASSLKPDITYLSASISLKPFVAAPYNPGSSSQSESSSSSGGSRSSSKSPSKSGGPSGAGQTGAAKSGKGK